LAVLGKRVLVVDIDPQANLSIHFGVEVFKLRGASVYFLLVGQAKLDEVIMRSVVEGLDIIPSNIDLAGAEIELVGMPGREMILKEVLSGVDGRYDYLLIDCPPSLGLLTLNALTTVSEIFIPLQTEFFALQGMSKLLETFEIVKKRLNQSLEITGIIPCMFDARTRLSHEVLENIREYFENKVFKSVIRKNVKLAEAPSHGKPIFVYAPDSHGAEDFMALAREVIAQEASKDPTPVVSAGDCIPTTVPG
jgi:chromosome partitioning protein